MCLWRTGNREDDSFRLAQPSVAREPHIEAEIQHEGNVTDIQVVNEF